MEITCVPHDTAGLSGLDSHACVVLTRMRVRWQAAVKIDGNYLDARYNVGAAQTQLLVSLALSCSLLLSFGLTWSLLVCQRLPFLPCVCLSVCVSALCVRVYCGGSLCGDACDATAEAYLPMPAIHCACVVMPATQGWLARLSACHTLCGNACDTRLVGTAFCLPYIVW